MIYSGGQLYAYCKYLTLTDNHEWIGTDEKQEKAQEIELDLEVTGKTVKFRREHWEDL